jgi:hypothetical protein
MKDINNMFKYPIKIPDISLRWFYSCSGFNFLNPYGLFEENKLIAVFPLEKLYITG